MAFQIKKFDNSTGVEKPVDDPFLLSLARQDGDDNPFLSGDNIEDIVGGNRGVRREGDRIFGLELGDNPSGSLRGFDPSLDNILTQTPQVTGPSSGPVTIRQLLDSVSGIPGVNPIEEAQKEYLLPFFEEQGEVGGLESSIEELTARIDRLGAPLRSSQGGVLRPLRGFQEALARDGLAGVESYYKGYRDRRGAISGLAAERDELLQTLQALDIDGVTATQTLRDYIRATPGDFPNFNPENETPEDVIQLFNEAVYRRIEDQQVAATERYDSGFSGTLGNNIDGYYTLVNSGKVDISSGLAAADFTKFDQPTDFVDYFALELRFRPPGAEDEEIDDQFVATYIGNAFAQAEYNPFEEQGYTQGQARIVVDSIVDRVGRQENYSTAGDALQDWLAISNYFTR